MKRPRWLTIDTAFMALVAITLTVFGLAAVIHAIDRGHIVIEWRSTP